MQLCVTPTSLVAKEKRLRHIDSERESLAGEITKEEAELADLVAEAEGLEHTVQQQQTTLKKLQDVHCEKQVEEVNETNKWYDFSHLERTCTM